MHRKIVFVVWAAVGTLEWTPCCNAAEKATDYFPPTESKGGWRKNVDPEFIRSLGLDPDKLEEFGQYNLSVPNNRWNWTATGSSLNLGFLASMFNY